MTPGQIKELFFSLKTWKREGKRAPHKPLLVIYAISRVIRGEGHPIPYHQVKENLASLLEEFGPPRPRYRPEYPFVRLANDKIWDLQGKQPLDSKKDWGDGFLLENQTTGGFKKEIYCALKKDKELAEDLIAMLLEQNFPSTFHEDILQAVGLNLGLKTLTKRDPRFRERILRAYEYQCSVCGFQVRLEGNLVCLEAAHIKWHQAGGPDVEQNGIALCTMHHKLFDRGAFTVNHSMQFQVAEAAHGTVGYYEWLMKYHGRIIRYPQRPQYQPHDSYIDWHATEVFRDPARYKIS